SQTVNSPVSLPVLPHFGQVLIILSSLHSTTPQISAGLTPCFHVTSASGSNCIPFILPETLRRNVILIGFSTILSISSSDRAMIDGLRNNQLIQADMEA